MAVFKGVPAGTPFLQEPRYMDLEDSAKSTDKPGRTLRRHGDVTLLDEGDTFSAARALIASRQNVSPKRLVEPGLLTLAVN